MWYIPDDQITKIQNRMSDIRNTPVTEAVNFIAATYELLGTLDTVLFDQRNLERKNKSTMILPEDKKDGQNKRNNSVPSKVAQVLNPVERTVKIYKKDNKQDSKEDNAQSEKKMNSHERRKERRRLEREAAKAEAEKVESSNSDKSE